MLLAMLLANAQVSPKSSSSQAVQWATVVHVLTNVAVNAGVGEFGDRYFCD